MAQDRFVGGAGPTIFGTGWMRFGAGLKTEGGPAPPERTRGHFAAQDPRQKSDLRHPLVDLRHRYLAAATSNEDLRQQEMTGETFRSMA